MMPAYQRRGLAEGRHSPVLDSVHDSIRTAWGLHAAETIRCSQRWVTRGKQAKVSDARRDFTLVASYLNRDLHVKLKSSTASFPTVEVGEIRQDPHRLRAGSTRTHMEIGALFSVYFCKKKSMKQRIE